MFHSSKVQGQGLNSAQPCYKNFHKSSRLKNEHFYKLNSDYKKKFKISFKKTKSPVKLLVHRYFNYFPVIHNCMTIFARKQYTKAQSVLRSLKAFPYG